MHDGLDFVRWMPACAAGQCTDKLTGKPTLSFNVENPSRDC
jgi:hypothetical protein